MPQDAAKNFRKEKKGRKQYFLKLCLMLLLKMYPKSQVFIDYYDTLWQTAFKHFTQWDVKMSVLPHIPCVVVHQHLKDKPQAHTPEATTLVQLGLLLINARGVPN